MGKAATPRRVNPRPRPSPRRSDAPRGRTMPRRHRPKSPPRRPTRTRPPAEEAGAPVLPLDGDVAQAMELLGVGPGASAEEIRHAFRERSKTCHPDKVAHLDEDFQALAHTKFQRLRAAFELLVS